MSKRKAPRAGHNLEIVALKLMAYCREQNWAGYDPYDALNSRLFAILPFLNSRLPRIALTQALKRSPVNLRRFLFIPKAQNPKALGLFLSAFVKLRRAGVGIDDRDIALMLERLIALRDPSSSYWCWGYSFPWQTRSLLAPAGAANLVCTTFVAGALLDTYEHSGDARCLNMAASAAEYLLNDLYWTEGSSIASFSYPSPAARSRVHNANLMAAALLCRVSQLTGEAKFLAAALKAARYSVAKQNSDGSWFYGEEPSQQWIDNFHTGYNLCALLAMAKQLKTAEFDLSIERGFNFYREHFFRSDGAPRYFHDQTYPIDIHCVAQAIITLWTFREMDPGSSSAAQAVLEWALDHMWDPRGFFYYRVLRLGAIQTSYMRWSQAWMLLALATALCESSVAAERPSLASSALA